MVCLSEWDFCLSFSSFSSCLSSLFQTCLNFLISAYGRRRVVSWGPSPPRGPRRSAVPLFTWVCFIWVEFQRVDHLGLQPLDLGARGHTESEQVEPGRWWGAARPLACIYRALSACPELHGGPSSHLGVASAGDTFHLAEPCFLACTMGIRSVPAQGFLATGWDPALFHFSRLP